MLWPSFWGRTNKSNYVSSRRLDHEDVFRMMFAVLCIVCIASCASLSEGGKAVQLTYNPNDVLGCKPLGIVSANPPFVTPNDWNDKLRNKGAELGANFVLSEKPLIGAVSGQGYLCE